MKKILYVEDEADHIVLIKVLLESVGFNLITAMDGKSGLKSVFENKPDLVLLDLEIPELKGIEVLKKIKADSRTKNIPVFIITAHGDKDKERECRDLGAAEFIRKPYDSNELIKKIERSVKK